VSTAPKAVHHRPAKASMYLFPLLSHTYTPCKSKEKLSIESTDGEKKMKEKKTDLHISSLLLQLISPTLQKQKL
jgi:hypothetical protein